MQWNPGSGAHWSLPTGAWSSALTSVPVPRLGRGQWEEPGITLSVPDRGLHWREGKGFWATSYSRISSVQGHARHKTNYFPRPPGSPAREGLHKCPTVSLRSFSERDSIFSALHPLSLHLSFKDLVPASPRSPAHPQPSSSSGVGGSFRNLQGKKFRSPGYELGSDPRAEG